MLLDRFVDSSLAYQGAGRAPRGRRDQGHQRLRHGRPAARPDAAARARPAEGRARASGRGEAPDRLEQEADGFFARIGEAYADLAREEPGRWVVLDAAAPPDQVLELARQAVGATLEARV